LRGHVRDPAEFLEKALNLLTFNPNADLIPRGYHIKCKLLSVRPQPILNVYNKDVNGYRNKYKEISQDRSVSDQISVLCFYFEAKFGVTTGF
jgi:hypothetical protein